MGIVVYKDSEKFNHYLQELGRYVYWSKWLLAVYGALLLLYGMVCPGLSLLRLFLIVLVILGVGLSVFTIIRLELPSPDIAKDSSRAVVLLAKKNKGARKLFILNLIIVLVAILVLAVALVWDIYGCPDQKDDGKLETVFVQINDVYSIAPLDGGKAGGMARVATLVKEQKERNPNTMVIMAGDFLSPSVFNTVRYKDQPVFGKQMVEAMNAAGVDLTVFGNHEFDLRTDTLLQQRIEESSFRWLSSNAFHMVAGNKVPFTKQGVDIPEYIIEEMTDADGTRVRIGFIGLTIPVNKPNYVTYDSVFATAQKLYDQLSKSCDAVIAVTHQSMEDDEKLALQLPGLALIIGGHEHDMQFKKVGNVYITKAHSNAKSAFIIKMVIDKKNKKLTVRPDLKCIDSSLAFDCLVSTLVGKWDEIAFEYFTNAGYSPRDTILKTGEPLDARDEFVRKGRTNFTSLVADAMKDYCQQSKMPVTLSFFNGGSIRVDEILPPPVTQFNILEALPYPGKVRVIEIKGPVLKSIMDSAKNNVSDGGFLQYSTNVRFDENKKEWQINNIGLNPATTYKVALSDYLLRGTEKRLGILDSTKNNITIIDRTGLCGDPGNDVRKITIAYLKKAGKSTRRKK